MNREVGSLALHVPTKTVVSIVRYPEAYNRLVVVREAQCDDEGPGPVWAVEITDLEDLK